VLFPAFIIKARGRFGKEQLKKVLPVHPKKLRLHGLAIDSCIRL
jgi:hypothetical protein